MDIAVVIGANNGVGLTISKKLITLGFRVYAIAEDFSKIPFAHKDFIPTPLPLNDLEKLKIAAKKILEKEDNISMLVNSQQIINKNPSSETVQNEFHQYLLNPILLTLLFIDKLKQFHGFIINIVYENPHNALNAAIESGLSGFYNTLFEKYRQEGLSITQLLLQSPPHSQPINSDMIATTIDHLIRFKGTNVITKILISPPNSTEKPIYPAIDEFKEILLPDKHNFPPEPKPIKTTQPKPKTQKLKKSPLKEKKPIPIPAKKTPKTLTRETVIIPREKKQHSLKSTPPHAQTPPLPISPPEKPTLRIRRGRPSTKEKL